MLRFARCTIVMEEWLSFGIYSFLFLVLHLLTLYAESLKLLTTNVFSAFETIFFMFPLNLPIIVVLSHGLRITSRDGWQGNLPQRLKPSFCCVRSLWCINLEDLLKGSLIPYELLRESLKPHVICYSECFLIDCVPF